MPPSALTRASSIVLAGMIVLSCGQSEDRPPVRDSSRQPSTETTDHAVYSAVLRHERANVQHGEHGKACEPEEGNAPIRIVAATQPIPANTPKREIAWRRALPPPAAPLLASLRAMNGAPPRTLDAARLALDEPVTLVPAAGLDTGEKGDSALPLWWFSRVAYTPDGEWALVYVVQVCPGVTQAMVEEAETGAYESVFLAPLQRRGTNWIVHPPLYLDVGLPRLQQR